MKTAPFLMSGALLLWGWQTGFLIWAGLMALILELSHIVKSRWDLGESDLNRIWDLCIVLFIGAFVILWTSEDSVYLGFTFARWQPFLFFPMILAQAFGNHEKVTLRTFSWLMRRRKDHALAQKGVNVTWLYFAVCLMAASAVNRPNRWFYPALAALISIAVLIARPRRLPVGVCIGLLCVATVGGFFGQNVLRELQSRVEAGLSNWLSGLFQRQTNFKESRTAIGEIGLLKLSGRIILRVQPEEGDTAPTLLREATYDNYSGSVWTSGAGAFSVVGAESNDTYKLQAPKRPAHAVHIAGYMHRGKGLLSLPHGAFELGDLFAALETNSFSVVKAEGPSFVNFTARYGAGSTIDAPPTDKADFDVPDREVQVLDDIVKELRLKEKTEAEALATVATWFQNNFTYSTFITRQHVDPTRKLSPLGVFLTRMRSGHCEYFATATVLLLRRAGIPARYATGYAVQESAKSGNEYIVRERHGHAWTLVYRRDKNVWEDFDTTPASWDEVEDARASSFEKISDAFSWIGFQFSKWRWGKTNYTQYLPWLLAPLIGFLAWRILFRKRRRARTTADELAAERLWPGMDSEFYSIEARLAEAGLHRHANETWHEWLERLKSVPRIPATAIASALQLHQRLRFDPHGVSAGERAQLRETATTCAARLQQELSRRP